MKEAALASAAACLLVVSRENDKGIPAKRTESCRASSSSSLPPHRDGRGEHEMMWRSGTRSTRAPHTKKRFTGESPSARDREGERQKRQMELHSLKRERERETIYFFRLLYSFHCRWLLLLFTDSAWCCWCFIYCIQTLPSYAIYYVLA